MKQVVVEKKRGKESPKFAFTDNGIKVQRAESMQDNRIDQCASPQFDTKSSDIKQNESNYGRSTL